MLSASDLIPDELQVRLLQAAENVDDAEWLIGDSAVELVDAWRAHGVKPYQVRAAIAQYSHKTPATVRDLEGDSRHIPQVVRREFIPPYSRSHLSVCIPFVQKPSDFGRILEEWQSAEDTRGMSVASLRRYLHKANGDEPAWKRTLAWVLRGCERLMEYEDTPSAVRRAASLFCSSLPASTEGGAPSRQRT